MLTLRLDKEAGKAVRAGFPWVYAGQFAESAEQAMATPDELCEVATRRGEFLGIGMFNAASQIACRMLTQKRERIDEAFFAQRLAQALARREKIFREPYYRLVHAEADGLPGLIIDRFSDICVLQITAAGMERCVELIFTALDQMLKPQTILLRNDAKARVQEGLAQEVRLVKGDLPELVEVHENGCRYLADLRRGQKTGWFYDQRVNRAMMAERCAGKTVIDVYAHSGGFGLPCALRGGMVTLVDSSALALGLAAKAATLNHVAERCMMRQGDAVETMTSLAAEGKQFDVVIADPPAFVQNKKDITAGLKGYVKVARHAAALVSPGGLLFVASCSHHASAGAFEKSVLEGIEKAGRSGKVLRRTGAAPDHPVHPQLPQSAYLKAILAQMED